jgi:hypothetical protein
MKCLKEADSGKSVKDCAVLKQFQPDGTEKLTDVKSALHSKFPILLPINAVDIRQFAILQKNNRLMEVKHIQSYLQALSTLPPLYEEKWKTVPESFGDSCVIKQAEWDWSMEGNPTWPKVRALGRAHPKIIAMQLMLLDAAGSDKVLKLFLSTMAHPLFRHGHGLFEAPDPTNDKEVGEFDTWKQLIAQYLEPEGEVLPKREVFTTGRRLSGTAAPWVPTSTY